MIVYNRRIRPLHFRGTANRYEGGERDFENQKAGVIINIIVMSKERGCWFDFTFDDYKKWGASRTDFGLEESCLESLVTDDKMLDKVGQAYSINDRFFRALANHLITPVAVPAR